MRTWFQINIQGSFGQQLLLPNRFNSHGLSMWFAKPVVISFTYDSVDLRTEHLQAEDYILLVNGSGYHDEDDFIVEDEDGEFLEYDYDIELSFPGYIDGILTLLHDDSLCEYGRSYTGAGRNG